MAATAAISLSGIQTVDGVVLTSDDRVLVMGQADATTNGIYAVGSGNWTREPDFDDNNDVSCGTLVPVNSGSAHARTIWRVTTTDPVVIGTSSIALEPSAFLTGTGVTVVNTISELKALTNLVNGQLVSTLGYYTAGVGAGNYRWDSTSTDADNGVTVHALNAGGTGRFKLQFSYPLHSKQAGAKHDGVTDDYAALVALFTAGAGGSVFIDDGLSLVTQEIAYDTAAHGPITIWGNGQASELRAAGVANKVLHITGTAGVTRSNVLLQNFAISSGTSGTSAAGLHLDGIADFWVNNVMIDGKSKMTTGLLCTAAQQGEVSGGLAFNCTNGAVLEDNAGGGVRSNGIDWHGMTFVNSSINFKVALNGSSWGADDVMFHHNHLTSAAMQIDVGGGAGLLSFVANHLEPTAGNNGAIIRNGRTAWTNNTFYGIAGTTDINISGGASTYGNTFVGNLINANVTVSAGSTDNTFVANNTGGTLTDSGTRTTLLKNVMYSGSGFSDKLTLKDAASGLPPLIVSGKSGSQVVAISVDGGNYCYLTTAGASDESFIVQNGSGGATLKVDKADPGAGNTSLFIVSNPTGSASLVRATVGAADSGGAGYRLLRVPN